MLAVEGYEITDVIHRTARMSVYSGHSVADGQRVVVKALNAQFPDNEQIAEIRREFDITRKLAGIDGVINVRELVTVGEGSLAIVMDEFGTSLAEQLREGENRPLSLERFFHIALTLVDILEQVHGHGIVHADLVPRNILTDGPAVRMIDFGLSSELSQECQGTNHFSNLVGSLPYISPEQTGRTNRYLDYRSDYYMLGATFYELLTGQRMFAAADPLEWVHSHISRVPRSPDEVNSDVPPALAQIVMRLLAKNAEDRYQGSAALRRDLHRVCEAVAAGSELTGFVAGQNDDSHVFKMPQRLYGRDGEIEALHSVFRRVVQGDAEICLVSGYSGVGKSALISELCKPLVAEYGFLIQGKYEQLGRNTPYLAVAAALKSLVRQLLAEPQEQLQRWREQMLEALAGNGQVLVELVPELEHIIGPQPALLDLPAVEAQNRFQIVFLNFIKLFASASRPLVIFLDDLQWSDAPTLNLLQRLMTSRELSHLMLIGAYRSNEVDEAHALSLTLAEISKIRPLREFSLQPLGTGPVVELVADTMHCSPDHAGPLAVLLHRKSEGNPFFIGELLKRLSEDGHLSFDDGVGHWTWDIEQVEAADISDNVIDFVLANLRRLSPDSQRLLQLAACIGNSFDLATLASVAELSMGATSEALMESLQRGLVVPRDSRYKLVMAESAEKDINPGFRFQHDRIQQAAYALIEDERRQQVHLSIGRRMQATLSEQAQQEQLLEITNHLNRAVDLIELQADRAALAALNCQAAERAQQAAAYESALVYLQIGLGLLPDSPWENAYELSRDLNDKYMQCAYQTGRYQDCEDTVELLLDSVRTDLERAEVLATRTRQYATMGKMAESIRAAVQGLRLVGMDFRSNPGRLDVMRERALIRWNLGRRDIADLIDGPKLADPGKLVAMRLLMEIFPAAFLSGQGNLLPYQVMKAVNLCLRYGQSQESAFAYAAYGMVLCGVLDEPALGYEYGKLAVAINERSDEVALKSRVIYVYGMFVHHWNNHWASMTPWFKRGIEAGYQSGDLLYLAYSAQDCVIWDPSLDFESLADEQRKYLQVVRDCEYQDSFDSGTLYRQMVLNFMGRTREQLSMDDDEFDETACVAGMRERQFMTGIANYQIYKAEICYAYGEFQEALKWVEAQEKMLFSSTALPQMVRCLLVAFLTRSALLPGMSSTERRQAWKSLKRYHAQMKRWAANYEANFGHLDYLMRAEMHRLRHNEQDAMHCYAQAIARAGQNKFLRDEAVANELAAKFFLEHGHPRAAEGYVRSAYYRYYRLKAERKLEHLQSIYPEYLSELVEDAAEGEEALDTISVSAKGAPLDLATVMKASQAISGELVLSQLLAKVMQILLENAGGQSGYLLHREDAALVVEAQAATVEGVADLTGQQLGTGSDPVLPLSLINYALGSGEALVVDDASTDDRFLNDLYVQLHRPRSVLCVPVKRQREGEGLIYMENNLAPGVFTAERLEMVEMLAAQATISIENAQLYDNLELKVERRTEELARALHDLQRTQGQLVQSEKMAGLGTLVAGVAHEINNPTNFVSLGAASLDEDLSAFRDLLFELLGEDNDPEVIEHFQDQFGRLFKALGNINEGASRIGTIVRDLRTFSRLDEAEKKRVPLVENLESTLRLVSAQYRANVDFRTEFSVNPEIDCFPAQLNQVFLNMMMNACQAIVARYEGDGSPPENTILGSLTLETRLEDDEVRIDFIDTGIGMSAETQQKVFEPFFTTKAVGEGTGMGMSISYQIIEKHEGRFAIESEEGVGTLISLYLPLN